MRDGIGDSVVWRSCLVKLIFCVSLVVLYIKFINFLYDCESKKKKKKKKKQYISKNSEKKNGQIS